MDPGADYRSLRRIGDRILPDLLSSLRAHPTNIQIPIQPGLPFQVSLEFGGDELYLNAGEAFWCEWFPASCRAADCFDTARALLRGNYRLVEQQSVGSVSFASIEHPIGRDEWVAVECGKQVFPWPFCVVLEVAVLQATPK